MQRRHILPGFGAAFAAAGVLVPAGWAEAQTQPAPSCVETPSGSGTYVCTIPAGSYTSPVSLNAPTPDTASGTGAGDVTIVTPAGQVTFTGALQVQVVGNNGADSSTGTPGNGTPGGTLQFTNTGNVSQTITTGSGVPVTAYAVEFASLGGDGGSYTNTNTNYSAGSSAFASAVQVTNGAAVQVTGEFGPQGALPPLYGGAGLIAQSLGGQGGNVTSRGPDQNGNPQYGSQNGTGGSSGADVTLTNSGAITIGTIGVIQGYWALAGRSLGGNGGTGNDGTPGGVAYQVTVTNTAPVSMSVTWIAPSGTAPAGTPTGVFGVLALSQGGNGNMSVNSGNDGGNGGDAGTPIATVAGSQGAPVAISVSAAGTPPSGTLSAAIGAVSLGGNGGSGYDSSFGGYGGNAGAAWARVSFAEITAGGDGVLGVLALSQGGKGGDSGIGQNHSSAQAGGATSQAATSTEPPVTIAALVGTRVSTSGSQAPAVAAIAQGGAGGAGQDYTQAFETGAAAGMGGAGGVGGPVRVEMLGSIAATSGAGSPGVIALSRGGAGGIGGDLAAGEGDSGTGGAGGAAGSVVVRILGDTTIATSGAPASNGGAAFGISASSIGGAGGGGGAINVDLGGAIGDGGVGGNAGPVTVQLGFRTSVSTTGPGAIGVLARSVGGAGGPGSQNNSSGGIATNPGDGGASGNSGSVTVDSAATISTAGNGAHGIMALSISGTSGSGGNGTGIIYGPAGSTGASGTVGAVLVNNAGFITTRGQNAVGIQAQSIGGGSGTPGSTNGGFFGVGGSSPAAANGGTASVTHAGSVSTAGQSSIGVLVQSIGGGGGNGGDSNEVIGAFGGSAGGGGTGAAVTATLDRGSIATTGGLAHGLVAQSIGGGGGTGGNATSTGTVVTMSYGGTGGDGGDAGPVTVTATGGRIGTFATNAAGIVAQSIGGGGGAGGSAYSTTAGLALSVSVAIGASAGSGSAPQAVGISLSGTAISTGQGVTFGTNTNPVDAFGILAQSVGGGGGLGGSAMAQALAFGLPNPVSGSAYSGAVSFAMGGTGGSAGNGGQVSLSLEQNATIITQGQGSHGILLQSIGGGGGAGGDSSALASTVAYGRPGIVAGGLSWDVQGAVSIGGDGQYGGTGGNVSVTLGTSAVTTFGDYANALVAQSIGGGGGNGGIGSSNTLNYANWRDINMSLNLGGRGGAGGAAGLVTITQEAGSVIETYGSGAIGIVAQGIGGGGGTSQGGGFSFGGEYALGIVTRPVPKGELSVQVGGTGGSGGNGGTVNVTVAGVVRTTGGDAPGVVLQSIGGGGGIGGAAGTDASSDNPVDKFLRVREVLTDIFLGKSIFGLKASVSVGGTGGTAGDGGGVYYAQSGSIATQGDWSMGAVLQAIGGGGGKGGVATSSGSGLGLSTEIAVGGSGGGGGVGGPVQIAFSPGSSIATGAVTANGVTGYGAFGVLAQSIGGSGGLGVDGNMASTGTIRVGATIAGGGGSGGDGYAVSVSGTTTITTLGDVAAGMVLQSIGGGGGVAGNGSAFTVGIIGPVQGSISIGVGGSNGVGGNGGAVTIPTATATIATSGANAYGILAQSIGGGGGFGFSSNLAGTTTTSTIGAQNVSYGQAVGNGGSVSLTLAGGAIRTSGFGSHAMVVQSIGGGGGIAGVPAVGAVPTMIASSQFGSSSVYAPGGSGGSVTINSTTPITTTGDFAHGLVAQSVGGGGGLLSAVGPTVIAGTSSAALSTGNGPNAPGGTVTVTQSAPISATGDNSVGIFAQSSGTNSTLTSSSSVVSVSVNAAILGGSGPGGLGIWVDSYDPSSVISISAAGSVSALSGNAIWMYEGAVFNYGTVTGSYRAPSGFYNYGTLNAGDSLVAATLVNDGTLRVAAQSPYGVSRVSGEFVQTQAGMMEIRADFAARRADRLEVAGSATLAGRVRPVLASVLPNVALPFMTVAGTTTGVLEGEASPVFGYGITQAGGVYSIAATSADFTPAGFALSSAEAAVAGHLQAAWDAGGSQALAPFFAQFGNAAASGGAGRYAAQLQQLSPDTTFAPGARQLAGAQAFANAALSCPVFEGTTAMLVEGQCVWARVIGRTATQDATGGVSRFTVDSSTWQIGAQRELGGGWFLGGSLAYENGRLSMPDGLESGRGEAGYGAVTVKYQTGPWLFSGVAFGGGGSFETRRVVSLPGFGGVATGGPGLTNLGLALRGAYTLGREEAYLRSSLTLGAVHARSGSYQESGIGALNLAVSSASATIATLTPAIEIGGRVALAEDRVLRLFASGGVSFSSTDSWTQQARLAGAPAGAESFTTAIRMDPVVGRVMAGAQLYGSENVSLRLQYEGEFGSNLTGHGAMLSVAWTF